MYIIFVIQDLRTLFPQKILRNNGQEYDHEEIYFYYQLHLFLVLKVYIFFKRMAKRAYLYLTLY